MSETEDQEQLLAHLFAVNSLIDYGPNNSATIKMDQGSGGIRDICRNVGDVREQLAIDYRISVCPRPIVFLIIKNTPISRKFKNIYIPKL